jgi:hypothetical protein
LGCKTPTVYTPLAGTEPVLIRKVIAYIPTLPARSLSPAMGPGLQNLKLPIMKRIHRKRPAVNRLVC